jgi:UDP-N-acetylmuramyl pentapeptide phosphotransferase/UDP-N-acetylglucosamine-1-phosphate transferase
MNTLAGLITGFLVARVLWMTSRDLFASPLLARTNHRGLSVPTGVGVLLALVLVVVEGGRALAGAAGIGSTSPSMARSLVLLAALGFASVGFVDDVLGGDADRGWQGHIRALRDGRLSAGGIKILGGGALALMLASAPDPGFVRVLADGVLIALAANLGNAFDRAPGRTIKVAILAWVPLAVAAGDGPAGTALAPAMGAAVGLLPDDLGEQLMLGDAGSNALGAVLGVGAILALGPGAKNLLLLSLVALNAAAELVSFSRVIDRTPPLRKLDRLGRRR